MDEQIPPHVTPVVTTGEAVDALFTAFDKLIARYIDVLRDPQMAVPMQAHEVQRLTNEWRAYLARLVVNGLSKYLEHRTG